MFHRIPFVLFVLVLFSQAGPVEAAKVLATRTEGTKSTGVRRDITVPYLTTGYTAFMADTYVGVRIYHGPMVDDPYLADVRPVYNLPFWGGIQGFSTLANGVMPTGLAVTPRELSPAVRPNAAMPVGTVITIK